VRGVLRRPHGEAQKSRKIKEGGENSKRQDSSLTDSVKGKGEGGS
jgi:hypothetical protein